MTEHTDIEGLTAAVGRYFQLMYDADIARFETVFRPSAQLHGFRGSEMTLIPAAAYKQLLASRPSPKSLGAPREEAILLMDFASDAQALVKVRVRIAATVYVDYLTYHRIDGTWLITAKGFHIERQIAA
jgi:hypothetical protein